MKFLIIPALWPSPTGSLQSDDKKLRQRAILYQNRALSTNPLIPPNTFNCSTLGQIKLGNRYNRQCSKLSEGLWGQGTTGNG